MREDVLRYLHPAVDPEGYSLFSEFIMVLPIEEIVQSEEREFRIRAVLSSGESVQKSIGTFEFKPGTERAHLFVEWPASGPKVAICMATYNPPIDLLKEQIASIQNQDHPNWICIITDDSSDVYAQDQLRKLAGTDSRFVYIKNQERRGFYKNFEHALSLVPADADFVALADQDDVWYPNKLTTLINALDGGADLAFSDCRIVNSGTVLSDTYWTARKNHYDDFASLFMANTVTGAASLFRADLIDYLLPFPPRLLDAYHDQWIGLTAQVRGGIVYVDEPLYSYTQHGGNVIGHTYQPMRGLLYSATTLARHARNRRGFLDAGRRILNSAWDTYSVALEKSLFAETLKLRHARNISSSHLRVVERMARYRDSLAQAIRFKIGTMSGRSSTMNVEGMLLNAMVGMRARNLYYRIRRQRLLSAVRTAGLSGNTAQVAVASSSWGIPDADDMDHKWIFKNLEPLQLSVGKDQPKRVNLLLATIDFRYIFGGYIGMFSLALRLRREGFVVRIVLLERSEMNLSLWREGIKGYPGVTEIFDEVEVLDRYDRSEKLVVSPDDRFVATNCWGAHVAHIASRELGQDRFMFMVQEYEPYFLPMNTISALFQQSYEFPQFYLFSTPHLRDFFKQNRIGLFAHPDSDDNHAVFKNAIQKFKPSLSDMQRQERRILFYARPEAHAARNLFELGMKALVELARSPDFDAETWKIYGMGSIGGMSKVRLAPNVIMEMMPKTDLRTYVERMPLHDVGLSLMLTPHPSLVPLEMASAGMWTVTNTFANKTAASLEAISSNIIAVEPTLEGVIEGLRTAISRVDQYDARLAGAKVDWPSNWDDAFPPEDMAKVLKFLADG